MEVVLVSRDADLRKVCREVLGELLGKGWGFTVREDAEELPSTADLFIWDYEPGTNLLERLKAAEWQNHLILLQREYRSILQESHFPQINVILKPFTAATLRTFLGQACQRFRENPYDENLEALRADRNELLQCVIQTNLKLQEYDQDRTNFLARAVHDFRAPLTALTGYCGLLLGEQLGAVTEDQKEVLQRMQRSAKRLSRMANAMFQLSIWQRVERPQNLQKNDIRESIEQALYETQPSLDEKGIRVSLDVRQGDDPLMFEKFQMEQVLVNLLDNACKFTPRRGSIALSAYPYFWERRCSTSADKPRDRRTRQTQRPNAYRVDVRDSGPGVPRDHLEHIFEEYTSYGGGQDRSGGGLGLAICKMIINQHQGRIWAESTPAGAVFSFVLPMHQSMPVLPEANQAAYMLMHSRD